MAKSGAPGDGLGLPWQGLGPKGRHSDPPKAEAGNALSQTWACKARLGSPRAALRSRKAGSGIPKDGVEPPRQGLRPPGIGWDPQSRVHDPWSPTRTPHPCRQGRVLGPRAAFPHSGYQHGVHPARARQETPSPSL